MREHDSGWGSPACPFHPLLLLRGHLLSLSGGSTRGGHSPVLLQRTQGMFRKETLGTAGGRPGPVEGNRQEGAGLLPWVRAAGAWSQLGLGLARGFLQLLTQWQPVLGITKCQALTPFALGNPLPSSPKSTGIQGQRAEMLGVTDPFGPGCLRPKACPLGLRPPGPPPQYRQTCSAGRLCSGVGRLAPLSPWLLDPAAADESLCPRGGGGPPAVCLSVASSGDVSLVKPGLRSRH